MSTGGAKGLTKREAFWLEHVRVCEGSGQVLAAYARSHDLGVGQFYSWRSRLRRKGLLGGWVSSGGEEKKRRTRVVRGVTKRPAELGFAPVRVAREEPVFELRIRFGNGTVLECGRSFPEARLRSLLAALS